MRANTLDQRRFGLPSAETAAPNFLFVLTIAFLVVGLLTMTSASVEIAAGRYGDAFYHFKRQAIFALMGCVGMLITLHVPLHYWKKYSVYLLAVSFVLLVLVLIPGIGKEVNGSARWIDLKVINLQPSELGKVFIVVYLAAYLERHLIEVQQQWSGFIKPLLIVIAAVVLLQMEPDHGAIVILLATAFCMIFLAGAKLHRFVLMLTPCVLGVYYIASTMPHVLQRFTSFMDPWAAENVYGDGYQLTQALIAFGRGEWTGVGLGNSIQKLYFLPEAHNDFVLAIIGEEFGLLGVAIVVLMFTLLVGKAISIGKRAHAVNALFASFLAYGLALLFAGQALINVGVNIQLLPTKGLTLPFFSQGGASLIVSCMMMAMLMRIEYETLQAEGDL